MTHLKLAAAPILAFLALVVALAPTVAQARTHHHHHAYPYWLPYQISYLHNYGPGPLPGTYAYYDGPSRNLCYQSAAAYIGQDHRRHPCF